MSDAMKSLLFAAVIGIVCSLLLTAASSGLKAFQQENALVDRQRNVLKSVGALEPERKYGTGEIKELFAAAIKDIRVDANGQVLDADAASGLPLFLYTPDGQVQSYIVPVDSRGLWGRIYGYLAIDNDGRTVTGFSVYQHSETPGLGGEIEKPWFQQNFVGRQIADAQGNLTSVGIAKGKVAEVIAPERKDHYVDGISGATLTGRYLSEGLKDILKAYEPVSRRFRDEGRIELPEIS